MRVSDNKTIGINKVRIVLSIWGLIPLIATLAYFIPPSFLLFFQWLGILMPYIMAISVILFIFAIVKKQLNYFIIIVYILGFLFYFPLRFQWSPISGVSPKEESVRVGTYNVRNMRSQYGLSTLHNVSDFALNHKVDVLLLQEVPNDYDENYLLEAFEGMKYIVFSDDSIKSGNRLAILSKHPLSAFKTLSHIDRPQYALFAHLNLKGKEVMLVNCHLQTTNWNQNDKYGATFVENKVNSISDNYLRREQQSTAIRDTMKGLKIPIILGGDFNDPPVSYSYHQLGSGLEDSFKAAGNGYSYTYRFLKKLYRIDYIFYDKDYFDGYNYRTVNLNYSDHLPILVDLLIKGN